MATRKDSIGLFWQDLPKEKPLPKEKIKREAPFPFWLEPTYLPGLEVARIYKPDLFNDQELHQASINKEDLIFDTESYPNYWLAAFKSVQSGKVVYIEMEDNDDQVAIEKLRWILHNFCIINFNGRKYDFPVTTLALAGYGSEDMFNAGNGLIEQSLRGEDLYKVYKTDRLTINQIDLIELTALGPGLKVCAGRLHAQRMQDLPFKPGTILTEDQKTILRWYCINDLNNTELLYKSVKPQIALRESVGTQFKIDLRSHSDAQMAEAIMSSEIKRIKGKKFLSRSKLGTDVSYKYKTPKFIKYESPLMQWVLDLIESSTFYINDEDGSVILPDQLKKLVINMGKGNYKIGIGGLHSQEKSIAHVADENYFIADTDATSYYPRLILNCGLYPENLGRDFIIIYDGIVTKRVTAKETSDVITAECLKIVANGTFGKLGSMWSIMYAPNLMLQVTITGQLSILMLAERFELNGIEVTSINTDGIVVKCHRSKESLFKDIVATWEKDTGFGTEEIRYKATYSKDINNYIAMYETPQKGKVFKTKGAYGDTAPKKNAVNEICVDAIKAFLDKGVPPATTIRACKDLTRFTSMRAVSGGAVHVESKTYLGKVIRWYYATGEQSEIIYAKNGNKVARTDGAKPCMDLPTEFPNDINYDWYIEETYKILEEIGHTQNAQGTV